MSIPSSSPQRVRGAPAQRERPVEVDWGLAYEAVIGLSLFVGGEQESTYDVGPAWFKTVRKKASPALRAAARNLLGSEGYAAVGLGGLVHQGRGRSVRDLVARLRADRAGDAKRVLLHCEAPAADGLLRGDEEAIRQYLADRSKSARELARRVLAADPVDLAAEAADLIERWDSEVFSELAPSLEGDLKAAAQAVSRLASQMPGDRLVLKATRGVEYRPEPWIHSIVLVPSVLNRPWVDLAELRDTRYIFYPASADSATPDVQLVEVYKALGDETRLRILRLLSSGETSLTEIAEKLGLAKSTVHGHMVILRTAGLTRSVVGGEGKGYVLNDHPDLNSLLDAYLKG